MTHTPTFRFDRESAAARAAAACFAVVAAWLLAGCETFVEPHYDVLGRRVHVVPFLDRTAPRNERWYGDSKHGRQVVFQLRLWAERQGVGDFLLGPDAERLNRLITNHPDDSISAMDWRRWAAGVPVDLVVIGEITEFRLKQPGDLNIYRGSAAATYRVIDVVTGRTVYAPPAPRQVRFPVQGETDIPIINLSESDTRQRMEVGLAKELGEIIGKDLYGYYED